MSRRKEGFAIIIERNTVTLNSGSNLGKMKTSFTTVTTCVVKHSLVVYHFRSSLKPPDHVTSTSLDHHTEASVITPQLGLTAQIFCLNVVYVRGSSIPWTDVVT